MENKDPEDWSPWTLLQGWEMPWLLWKILRQHPKRSNRVIPYDPVILLLAIFPLERRTYVHIQTGAGMSRAL